MPRHYRVGVVGFGMGGATVAFLLAKAGHEVHLFERAPRVGPVGAGILLQPSGQMVLRRLGLLDKVTRRAEPIEELHALTHRGGTLIRLPYAEIEPGCRAYGLHRGDLFEVLHEAVVALGAHVHLDHDIHSCRKAAAGVFVRDAHGGEHGPFDFLLAADGSRSTLRGCCRLTKWVHEYGYGAVWLIGWATAVRGKLHQVVRGTHDLLGLLPMGEGRCSLFWSLHRDEKEAVWRAGFAAWRERVLGLCPLAAELFEGVESFEQVAFTTYHHVWMRNWHEDRVLFLGDAAHAMSPHLGQGVNLALLDAYRFAEALAESPHPRAAFARYAQSRRRYLRYYAAVTFLLTPFFQSSGFIKGWGRDWALPWMTRVPWMRRQMLLTMAGVKGGFLAGPWRL
jgi:2-polyprenyl-6-methoxyphenol hydroxylase-like FAD-dependent oxidoreductase